MKGQRPPCERTLPRTPNPGGLASWPVAAAAMRLIGVRKRRLNGTTGRRQAVVFGVKALFTLSAQKNAGTPKAEAQAHPRPCARRPENNGRLYRENAERAAEP